MPVKFGLLPYGQDSGAEKHHDVEYWKDVEQKDKWPVGLISFEMWCAITMYDDNRDLPDGGPAFQHMIANLLTSGDQHAKFDARVTSYYDITDPSKSEVLDQGRVETKDVIPLNNNATTIVSKRQFHVAASTRKVAAPERIGREIGLLTNTPYFGGPGTSMNKSFGEQAGVDMYGTNYWVVYSHADFLGKANLAGGAAEFGASQGKANAFTTAGFDPAVNGKCWELPTTDYKKCPSIGNLLAAVIGLYYYPGCTKPENNWTVHEKVGDKHFRIRFRCPNPRYEHVNNTLVVREKLHPVGKDVLERVAATDPKHTDGKEDTEAREIGNRNGTKTRDFVAAQEPFEYVGGEDGFKLPKIGRLWENNTLDRNRRPISMWTYLAGPPKLTDEEKKDNAKIGLSYFGPYYGELEPAANKTAAGRKGGTWHGTHMDSLKHTAPDGTPLVVPRSYHSNWEAAKRAGVQLAALKPGGVAHKPNREQRAQPYQFGFKVAQALLLYPHWKPTADYKRRANLVKGKDRPITADKETKAGYQPLPKRLDDAPSIYQNDHAALQALRFGGKQELGPDEAATKLPAAKHFFDFSKNWESPEAERLSLLLSARSGHTVGGGLGSPRICA